MSMNKIYYLKGHREKLAKGKGAWVSPEELRHVPNHTGDAYPQAMSCDNTCEMLSIKEAH